MLPETTSPKDSTAPVNKGPKQIGAALVSFGVLAGLAILSLTGLTYILTALFN